MLENPCKPDCPDRSPTCHATCDKYFVFTICKEHERNVRYRDSQLKDDLFKTSRHHQKQLRKKAYADNLGEH